ncbi:MAG: hypothetical protein RL021_296 [Bacteroidota bacterium]|jgi:hypothetical protein
MMNVLNNPNLVILIISTGKTIINQNSVEIETLYLTNNQSLRTIGDR